jgi:hypothetical protein
VGQLGYLCSLLCCSSEGGIRQIAGINATAISTARTTLTRALELFVLVMSSYLHKIKMRNCTEVEGCGNYGERLFREFKVAPDSKFWDLECMKNSKRRDGYTCIPSFIICVL